MMDRMKTLVVAGALFVLGPQVPALAGPFEDAVDAFKKDEFATAMQLFQALSDQGDAQSTYNIGVMYDEGRGVPQDFAQAASWYARAANRGFAAAQYDLGIMYEEGQGVPKDLVQAYKWLSLSASSFAASGAIESGLAVKSLDQVRSAMTPDEIARAQALVQTWMPIMESQL